VHRHCSYQIEARHRVERRKKNDGCAASDSRQEHATERGDVHHLRHCEQRVRFVDSQRTHQLGRADERNVRVHDALRARRCAGSVQNRRDAIGRDIGHGRAFYIGELRKRSIDVLKIGTLPRISSARGASAGWLKHNFAFECPRM